MIVVGIIGLFAVVTLRQDAGTATGAESAALVATGQALVAIRNWSFLFGQTLMPCLNALLLGSLLSRIRLVPRAIPALGLIGAPLLLVAAFCVMFGLVSRVSRVVGAHDHRSPSGSSRWASGSPSSLRRDARRRADPVPLVDPQGAVAARPRTSIPARTGGELAGRSMDARPAVPPLVRRRAGTCYTVSHPREQWQARAATHGSSQSAIDQIRVRGCSESAFGRSGSGISFSHGRKTATRCSPARWSVRRHSMACSGKCAIWACSVLAVTEDALKEASEREPNAGTDHNAS